jgi:hypothetical protein
VQIKHNSSTSKTSQSALLPLQVIPILCTISAFPLGNVSMTFPIFQSSAGTLHDPHAKPAFLLTTNKDKCFENLGVRHLMQIQI